MLRFLYELTIFKKLALTFLLVLTPLYVLSLLMNESGSETLKTEISKSETDYYNRIRNYLKAARKRLIGRTTGYSESKARSPSPIITSK
ncbi:MULTISPECIES: hypothetical protein [Cohnella]|uniref:hypothetical protein n=1 Tax=Cohnella TaxID=329857 RepID=UPI0009BC57B4|nr:MULTISPECIES: hypothetical protein [Cohnella]MBN2983964.1 hypothetical protein [Cohnella algarum]